MIGKTHHTRSRPAQTLSKTPPRSGTRDSKAVRFRDLLELQITTNPRRLSPEDIREMMPPANTPGLTPSLTGATICSSFSEALRMRNWIETSRKAANFRSYILPLPEVRLL